METERAVIFGLPVLVIKETGCWIFVGRTRDGYGQVDHGCREEAAHRYFWRLQNGDIPNGVKLDHMCRNRACVRPQHMDPVTNRENVRRAFARYRRTIEVCPAGHSLAVDGVPTENGGTICRICCNL